IRTPAMANPGMATESLVQLVDLYPTLAELAGLTPKHNLDGQSLVPILNDPQAPGRDVVLSQFNRPWKATVPGRRPPRNRWATRSGQPHTATHAGSTGPTAQRWRRNFTTTRRRTACGAWIRV
ncbi:MAG: hypothetical protein KDA58_14065, partial [Planctomycetaceae bacterium]|nr:hypothetical protein [Planctomycetaceae bacterium]